jgi:hypothetical protein
LDQRDRYVAGARRQIDDEVVELSPFDLRKELADDGVQHGAAPNQRLIAGIKEADRNHAQAVTLWGQDAVLADDVRLLLGAEHERHVGAVNIGIEQSDLVAHARQSNRQINGERGLAYATLSRADSDDGIDAGQRLWALRLRLRMNMRRMRMRHETSLLVRR